MHPQERGFVACVEEGPNRTLEVSLASIGHDRRDSIKSFTDARLEWTPSSRFETLKLSERLAVKSEHKPIDDGQGEHKG